MDSDLLLELMRVGSAWGFCLGFIAFVLGYAFSGAMDFVRSL